MKFGVLQITRADGRQRELPLELPSLVVGRAEGTGILIDDLSISRRHARLVIDSGRLMVEDLGSAQGTFIDGERISPGTANLVDQASELRFGDIVVRFVPPPPAELPGATIEDEESDRAHDLSTASRLGVTLTPPNQPVYAGAPWIASVRVHNRSSVVDRVIVSVPDLPEDWVKIDRPALALPPGASETVELTVMPPRRAEALAGDYDFTVLVTSTEHQREATALGQFALHPFQNLALSFEAPRAKRNFVVVAENKGNEVQTYTLSGEDPDAAWGFEFELPSVTLQPGERRTVGLRVNRKRQLMGIATPLPFNVHAESDAAEPEKVTAIGQLAVNPPLQKFRGVAMFAVAAVVIAGIAIALMLVRDGEVVTKANAESPYAGVHLCDKDTKAQADARAKQEAAAAQSPAGGTALTSGSNSGAPFFAQNDPRWGKDEYARAKDPEFGPDWCGSTIEQCGCAMTSVATTMALFGLLTMPDGTALTPQALNNWFNAEATKTNRGWVSRGYIYGDVIWTSANQLSGEMAAKNPGAPTIRFSRTGNGSDDEIKEQLKQGRPIILEVPGHWIAAVGLDGDTIQINDPFYRDRKTLDVYKGKVKSSVIFEPSNDLSAVVFTAPADVRVRITDKQGRVVGTLATGSAEDAEKTATNEIPGASYSSRQAWRDPSCIESAPPSDAGTNQIILPGGAGDYKIEVLDASGKPTSISIHTYDKQGKSSIETHDFPGSAVMETGVDAGGKANTKVVAGAQPTPEKTPAGGGGGGPDQTVAPAGIATATRPPAPTPTPEPIVETGLAISAIPGDTFVAIQSQEGFAIGDTIIFSPGKANEEENRIIGFGSFILEFPLRYAHSPGEVIRKKPRPPGSSPATDRPLPPAPVLPPLVAPENLTLGCSAVYVSDPKEATMICTLDIAGTFTTTRWSVNGKAVDDVNNQQLLLMAFNSDGNAAVGVSVCNRTICKSTSFQQKIQFPAPGTAGGTTGGTGTGGTGVALPTQTPPPTGIVVNCTSQFEQGAQPKAVVTCAALFSGASTSISWSAPGGQPASGQGKTFTTNILPNTVKVLRVTATVCNFAVCQTSPTVNVGIGGSTTQVFLKVTTPPQTAPLNSTTTFTALVTGPQPPAGGTVQFRDGLNAIGASVPLFTAGSVGFAQLTVTTGTSPLIGLNTSHPINAVYSGGTNLFGSTSPDRDLLLIAPIPEHCNSINDNAGQDTLIDNGCDIGAKEVGGGTVVNNLTIAANLAGQSVARNNTNDTIVRPGATLSVSGNATRTTYCPGCLRQVYLAIAPNTVTATAAIGPSCRYSGGLGTTTPGVALAPWAPVAPAIPGIYYIRGSSTLDYSCVPVPPLGAVDHALGRVVVQAATTTSLQVFTTGPTPVAVNSINVGTAVTIVATITPANAPGSLRLLEFDGTSWQQVGTDQNLSASGQASFSYTPTTAGPHRLKATYFGYPSSSVFPDQWFAPSGVAGGVETEFSLGGLTGSTTGLVVSPTSAKVGESVTATVTVTPDDAFPTDGASVTLTAGGNPVGTATLAGGTASFTLTAGDGAVPDLQSYSLVASFAGAEYVAASTSPTRTLTVNKADSTITMDAPVPNPVTAGDTLVLTARVTGIPLALPTGGVVTFKAGNTVIATATVAAPPSNEGVATTSIVTDQSPLDTAGNYDITATFDGTGTKLNDSGPTADQQLVVQKAPATVTITSFNTPVTVAGSGSISVTVSPGDVGKVPGKVAGTVTFMNNGVALPNGTDITLADPGGGSKNGVATYQTANLNAGTYSNITVSYSGSTKYGSGVSSPAIQVVVDKANPVITVDNPGTKILGSTVTLTARIPGTGVLSPVGGTVQFFLGTTELCGLLSCPAVSGNQADLILTTPSLLFANAGAYNNITAVYSGNGNLNPFTSAGVSLTLDKATPTTELALSPTTVTIGSSVTSITATVAVTGISDPNIADGGTIQFKVGGVALGSAIAVSGGTASISNQATGVAPFTTGDVDYTITAEYTALPDNTNLYNGPASAAQTLRVNKAATTTALDAISPSSPTVGDTITLTAHVKRTDNDAAADSGTVTFALSTDESLGTGTVSGGTATLTFDTNNSPLGGAGPYTIKATYGGTAQLSSSVSGTQSLSITAISSSVALTFSNDNPTVGDANTFTAVVSVTSPKGPIEGTITFQNNGSALPNGTKTVTDVPGGRGATYDASGLAAGTHSIVAVYTDTRSKPKYSSAASTPPKALTVAQAVPSDVTILASPSTSQPLGTTFSFTVTVTSGSGLKSPDGGTVSLYVTDTSGTPFATSTEISGGSVTFTSVPTGVSPFASPGTYSIVAKYNSNTNVAAATSATPASITLTQIATVASLPAPTNPSGTSYVFTVTLTPDTVAGGPTGIVTFQEETAPGVWTDRATVTIPAGGPFTATYSPAAYASPSSHTIRAVYAGNTNYASATTVSRTVNVS